MILHYILDEVQLKLLINNIVYLLLRIEMGIIRVTNLYEVWLWTVQS